MLILGTVATSLIGCGEKGPAKEEAVSNAVSDAKKEQGTTEGNGIQLPDGGASASGPGMDGSPKSGK